MKELYSRDLPNIADLYMNKMFELEDALKEKNMTFYTNNILGAIVLYHFDQVLEESYESINKIAESVVDFPDNYILQRIILLCGLKNVLQYEKICRKMMDFSLNNIDGYAYDFFKSRQFHAYYPNWFYDNYGELKNILGKLGVDFGNMDELVEPVIEKQEKAITNLYECAIEEIGSNDEKEIREFIDYFVNSIRKEINEKQKTL